MGNSESVPEFSGKIFGAAIALGAAQTAAVFGASIAVKQVMEGAVQSMAGPDQRLSGTRSKSKISVGFDMYPGSGAAYSVMKVRGPIMLVEEDTPAHRIPKGGSGKGRGSRKKRYAVIDGHPYDHANHRGTTGKGRWKLVRRTVAPPVARVAIMKANAGILKTVF